MTGLERWAACNQTTKQEILILAAAENPEGYRAIIGSNLDSENGLPAGRDTALKSLLERGRAGKIHVWLKTIADQIIIPDGAGDAIESPIDVVGSAIQAICGSAYPEGTLPDGTPRITVTSDKLPAILAEIGRHTGQDGTSAWNREEHARAEAAGVPFEPVDAPEATSPVPDPAPIKPAAPKPASRRKTRYSANKAAVAELLKPAGSSIPIREIRAFLLSLPEYKPQDIALMNDADVFIAFNRNYVAISIGSGIVVMTPACRDALSELLVGGGAYCVPTVDPERAEGE